MSIWLNFLIDSLAFGATFMYGSTGEIITEKAGQLNLGIPGVMCMGGAGGCLVLNLIGKSSLPAFMIVVLGILGSLVMGMLMGFIYSFLTVSLRANQNVTDLALTTFGMGVANFFGVFILDGRTATQSLVYKTFQTKLPVLSGMGMIGQTVFGYGFMVYAAVILAIILHHVLSHTRTGLNLRAIGENPATADAAGISVTRYKYLATCLGAGISGLGGLYYVLDYNQGIWATTGQIEALGWLAVALVIFTTWKPLNAIWGSYLFGMLYWLYQFLPTLIGFSVPGYVTDLIQMVPYLVTIAVLIVISLRKKREDQPPASLGLAYFREER